MEDPVSVSNDFVSENEAEISETRPMASGEEKPTKDYKSVEDVYRESLKENKYKNLAPYWQLHWALWHNDWEQVEDFIEVNPNAPETYQDESGRTFFHIIARRTDREAIYLMKKYLRQFPKLVLERKYENGFTPLVDAAEVGNTEAAKLLVKYNKDLPNMRAIGNAYPIHYAALYGHKETVEYLLSVTKVGDSDEDSITRFTGNCGFDLPRLLIEANICDIAFRLLKRHPKLGRDEKKHRKIILEKLSEKPKAFASGSGLGYLQRLIYHCIPVYDGYNHYAHRFQNIDSSLPESYNRDVENPSQRPENSLLTKSARPMKTASTLGVFVLRIASMGIVPSIKHICDAKLMHRQTVGMVKMMLSDANEFFWDFEEGTDTLKMAAFAAIKFGIQEIAIEIYKAFFKMHFWADEDGNTVFMLAVLHRRDKILMHLYGTRLTSGILSSVNKNGNNMLHLAGKLEPSSKIPCAALQMQRDLQWFKLVKSIVQPSDREVRNKKGFTPLEMFTEEHKALVKEGQIWMKDTAESCTLVASLIITVVFAAAFTVPGGSNGESGFPVFLREKSFIVFMISDALALFSSTTSLLMFLGILTSRYSQEDFMMSLPRNLIIGLATLFFSIACLMVAFGATIHIVLSHPWKWVIIPIALLGCLPVTLFAFLQSPLLVEMILSTYWPTLLRLMK